MAKKNLNLKEGYTESVWKSLIIKSIRIGWPQGIEKGREILGKTKVTDILKASIFEDIFPVGFEGVDECVAYIEQENYRNLCMIATHHSRGYTQQFYDIREEASDTGVKKGYSLMAIMRQNSRLQWLTSRVFNCLYTWWVIDPKKGGKRSILDVSFTRMPKAVIDAHTYEGKVRGVKWSMLSGDYDTHLKLSKRMDTYEGLVELRKEFISDLDGPKGQQTLF
ncbi:MAG: hypothetical protein ACOC4Y_01500 [bacterium]